MMRTKKGATTVALGAVVTLAVAACSSGSGTSGATASGSPATKGGTIYIINKGPHNGLDPQASYVGADLEFANRVYARSLTTYTSGSDPKLIPDLATDTGTMTNSGKTWAFTLIDTAKWQDGQKVTCDDVKYGISRTFATDVISNGPTYMLSFLDVPPAADSTPSYKGPYGKSSDASVVAFNKAITCEGQKLTLHFSKAWADFNQATASLAAFSPFRKDKDKGANSLFDVFSNGPYMLSGTFDANKGGTWVRNPNWDTTDKIRKAYPDKIVDIEGSTPEQTYQRLIADGGNDKNAITFGSAPASLLSQVVTGAAKSRVSNPAAPYVDYLTPNYQSATMKNPAIRKAFAQATNRDAYITAEGGPQIMTPTYAICNQVLACYKKFNPFNTPTSGDPVAAKKTLADAGITTPVNITVSYRKTDTQDKAFSALKQTWDQGGFNVTQDPISDKYYRTIASSASKSKDVFWASWGADWPSGSTDIPPLFDSRINITATSSNQDYGYYANDAVNAAMDKAYTIADATEREKAWGAIDETINNEAGVVPLVNQKFVFLRGSNVKNYQTNALFGGYADFATIAVQ